LLICGVQTRRRQLARLTIAQPLKTAKQFCICFALGKCWQKSCHYPAKNTEKTAMKKDSPQNQVIDFTGFCWWRRRGSNPRPEALYGEIYMLSQANWI